MSQLYERRALPGNMRMHIAKTRAAKDKRTVFPKWLDDDKVRDRILRVYAAYIARTSLPDIMAAEEISITQIYKDIGRAREMRRLLFEKDIEHMLMEQVEAHRNVIREAQKSLAELRTGPEVNIPKMPTADSVTDDKDEPETDEQATKALSTLGRTPGRARAEADLLRVIAENEKMIEELLGLRDRKPGEEEPPLPPNGNGKGGVTVIIDARTQTLRVQGGKVKELTSGKSSDQRTTKPTTVQDRQR